MTARKKFIDLAVVVDTKGLKGHVKLKPFVSDNIFIPKSKFFISPPTLRNNKLTIEEVRHHKDILVVQFQEITDINNANLIKGSYLQKEASELPQNLYPQSEIIGCNVFDEDGKMLGKIVSIEESKGFDIFVMNANKKQIRISAVKEIVKEINIKEKKIIVNLPKGLMEL